jgi:hypothetical protein
MIVRLCAFLYGLALAACSVLAWNILTAEAQFTSVQHTLEHATDCRTLVSDLAMEKVVCRDQDDLTEWLCKDPNGGASDTICDRTIEWQRIGGILTDAEIPDTGITLSEYLPLAGGALTGTLTLQPLADTFPTTDGASVFNTTLDRLQLGAGGASRTIPFLWTHATDCTANVTLAVLGEDCMDVDSGVKWTCLTPAAGGASASYCDQAVEWVAVDQTSVSVTMQGAFDGGPDITTAGETRKHKLGSATTYKESWAAGTTWHEQVTPASDFEFVLGANTDFKLLQDDASTVVLSVTEAGVLDVTGLTSTIGAFPFSNLGATFTASDTNPDCATVLYAIFYDDSENKFKKCEEGVKADLDTGGGSAVVEVDPLSAAVFCADVPMIPTTTLTAIGATTITIGVNPVTLGFADASVGSPQTASIDGDAFTYTGESATAFTGVTGVDAEHASGVVVADTTREGVDDTYTCDLDPAPAGYVTNTRYRVKVGAYNTGAATINLNNLGAKTIRKLVSGLPVTLSDYDIQDETVIDLDYDGTYMILVTPNMHLQHAFDVTPTASLKVGASGLKIIDVSSAAKGFQLCGNTSCTALKTEYFDGTAWVTTLLPIADFVTTIPSTKTFTLEQSDADDLFKITEAGIISAEAAATVNFGSAAATTPAKIGTTPPGTCTVGQTFFDTNATAGTNWLLCTATNVWTAAGA